MMPYWFQFSKNQRRNQNKKGEKKYADPNNSTMNRICKAFDDIGNINMNFAGIAQFNWQMLLREQCTDSKPEIPLLFCELDNRNFSPEMIAREFDYASERQLVNGINMAAEDIERIMTEKYGSLENAYPYVVKYLFGGEGMNRSSHKQMFWRVFGSIALEILKENLASCKVCPDCFMRYPKWVKEHACQKNTQGFFECVDCGTMQMRTNSRQCRCPECQEQYRVLQRSIYQSRLRKKFREEDEERIMRLRSSSNET